ncbi:MAG: glycosyltransferase family 4 protein [Candidatus Aminicenantes bacterium]|nr:glycosyltransferase family 4 protein [Candidatus Aminicenantes bacterium]
MKPHELARALVRRGHDVTVITGFPNYPHGKIYHGYRMRLYLVEEIDEVRIIRIPCLINRSLNVVSRVLSYLSFSVGAIIAGLFKKEKYDVIWAYQLGLAGAILSLLKQIPFVHEVQDLWPEWAKEYSVGMNRLFYWILYIQEKFIYNISSTIITISRGFKNILVSKGVLAQKIVIIPNWADESLFYPAEKEEIIREEICGEKFRLMYVGNIGTAQRLENVIRAAEILKDSENIELLFIGDGVHKKRLEELSKIKGLKNVRFLGYKDPNIISKYMAWADVLLIHLGDSEIYEITIPSKTSGYLAVGKPILAVCKGDTADLISSTGVGITCEPGQPALLAEKIIEFSSYSKEKLAKIGKKARETYLSSFSKDRAIERYETIFRKLGKG